MNFSFLFKLNWKFHSLIFAVAQFSDPKADYNHLRLTIKGFLILHPRTKIQYSFWFLPYEFSMRKRQINPRRKINFSSMNNLRLDGKMECWAAVKLKCQHNEPVTCEGFALFTYDNMTTWWNLILLQWHEYRMEFPLYLLIIWQRIENLHILQ